MMRLAVTITPHGFGHAAQVVAVLRALLRKRPEIELHIASRLPESWLAERLPNPFQYHRQASDFGLVMHSPVQIDHAMSAAAYLSLYRDRYRLLEEEAEWLARIRPGLVLADVPWLPLAAAARLGIPAYALCSLNWAGIYRHFYGERPEGPAVHAWIREAYAVADAFLRPAPAMPMPELDNVRDIGPLAVRGRNCRERLRDRLGLSGTTRLVLVALGGVGGRLPVERWPQRRDFLYLVEEAGPARRRDLVPFRATGFSFIDLLASCDLVLGKCGYGTVAECAVNGTPLLAIRREDGWPEDAPLAAWLQRHGRLGWIDRRQAETGEFLEAAEAVLRLPAPPAPTPTGAEEAARILLQALGAL